MGTHLRNKEGRLTIDVKISNTNLLTVNVIELKCFQYVCLEGIYFNVCEAKFSNWYRYSICHAILLNSHEFAFLPS